MADVNAATDLLRAATLQAATDPSTGKIDMDLITSGFGQQKRQRTKNFLDNIRDVLIEQGPEMSRSNLIESVNMRLADHKADGKPMSTEEFDSVVQDMIKEYVVAKMGKGQNCKSREQSIAERRLLDSVSFEAREFDDTEIRACSLQRSIEDLWLACGRSSVQTPSRWGTVLHPFSRMRIFCASEHIKQYGLKTAGIV